MVQTCECNVVGSFPYVGGFGFTSITLRTNTPIMVTSDTQMELIGATTGELSVSAYGSLNGYPFSCPGKAGVSYDWMQRNNCLSGEVFYIPRGGTKSFIEGDVGVGVTSDISINGVVKYTSTQVSVSRGPADPYLVTDHTDGYDFIYLGGPIQIYGRLINVITEDGVFASMPIGSNGNYAYSNYGLLSKILPEGSELFLTSFSWDQTPPNVPNVSYSFSFTGAPSEILSEPVTFITCSDGTIISV